MKNSHGPVWLDVSMPEVEPLVADTKCDVCIVGGGIAGLLIARRLTNAGLDVVLLEKGKLAHGETGHTTAHFTAALDDRFTALERMHGVEGARLAAASHMAAIDSVEATVRQLGVKCGWKRVPGFLTVNEHHRDERESLLADELDACHRVGLEVERMARLPEPWPATLGPALRIAHQAQVHPVELLSAVARQLKHDGAGLHEQSQAKEIHGGSDAAVETVSGPVVRCNYIVVATNTPINNLVAVHTKQAGYQTYVMAFEIAKGSLPALLHWDGRWEDDSSYRYVRTASQNNGADDSHDLLIVGGEDHKTGQGPNGDEPFACIEKWTRTHFPMCGAEAARWSGEVMESIDGLGYIGHNAVDRDNVYIVTGDSGNGMTNGAIASLVIPDLILGRHNPWASLYDPARKVGVRSLPEYLRENLNTAAQYRDWLSRGDVRDESDIEPGQGAIIVKGMKRLAVYKDAAGVCTRLSAVCPHLGGVVRWNAEHSTWDCPCHGSRFEKDGTMMHGPANEDLSPADSTSSVGAG